MSKLKINLIALSIICAIVLFLSLKDDYNLVIEQLYNTNLWWFLLSLFMVFLYLTLRSIDMHRILKKTEKDYTFFKAMKIVILGQFFANVTPSSFGTQPAQIFFLTKENVRPSRATKVVVLYNVYYQMALVLIAFATVFIAIYTGVFSDPSVILFKKIVIVSLIFHTSILLILLGVNFSRRSNRKIIKGIIRILSYLKIVKNKEETMEKWDHNLNDFHTDAHTLMKNKKSFLISLMLNVLSILILYSIPIVLFIAIGSSNISLVNTIVASSYTNVISSFIPSPGGTGGFEYFFMQFFGVFISGTVLKTTMLLWRGVTYYFTLILGFIVLFFYKEREIKL